MQRLALALALATATVAAHAADKPAAAPPSAATTAAVTQAAQPPGAASRGAQVRNWAEIDTNRDHLISAEEMEKWLAAQWAQAAPAAQARK